MGSTAQGSLADLTAMAQRYLQDRVDRLTGDTPPTGRVGLTSVATRADLRQRLQADAVAIDTRRQRLRTVNGGHTRGEATVSSPALTTSGDSATLQLVEHTKLFYARVSPDSPEAEEYVLRHRFAFTRTRTEWFLSGVAPEIVEPALAPDTHPAAQAVALPEAATSKKRTSNPVRPKGFTSGSAPDKLSPSCRSSNGNALSYDYGAMTRYALQYWQNYNPDYRTYGGEGGDCTNFISQIVKAGGWEDVSGDRTSNDSWWYSSLGTWNTSYTWAAAENWFWFAGPFHSGRTETLDYVHQMGVSDVLQVDFDANDNISHSMFVTRRDGTGAMADELYLTYHSTDTLNKKFSSIFAANPDAWYHAHRT